MDANSIRYEFLKRMVKNKIRTFPYQILNEEEQKLRGEIEDLEQQAKENDRSVGCLGAKCGIAIGASVMFMSPLMPGVLLKVAAFSLGMTTALSGVLTLRKVAAKKRCINTMLNSRRRLRKWCEEEIHDRLNGRGQKSCIGDMRKSEMLKIEQQADDDIDCKDSAIS